jgi:hypothetical protein
MENFRPETGKKAGHRSIQEKKITGGTTIKPVVSAKQPHMPGVNHGSEIQSDHCCIQDESSQLEDDNGSESRICLTMFRHVLFTLPREVSVSPCFLPELTTD